MGDDVTTPANQGEQDSHHASISPFDTIRHETDGGDEYWSGRELAKLLDYTNWRNFLRVIAKAREACEGSGHAVSDHFVEADEMVSLGSGAQRKVEDVHLSRYTCYCCAMPALPPRRTNF